MTEYWMERAAYNNSGIATAGIVVMIAMAVLALDSAEYSCIGAAEIPDLPAADRDCFLYCGLRMGSHCLDF